LSDTVAATAPSPTSTSGSRYKFGKLDQWICFWSVPVFYTLFGLVFVPLSWMMPPRSPINPEQAVIEFMQSTNLLLASSILILVVGLSAVGNAIYMCQMRRMSVSPVLRYAFWVGAMTGAIVGALFPMFCFGLGAFRPGYDPAILQMLYDFGYMSFIGCLGCFFLNWSCLGLAILLDEKNTLPRWLGYYTIWQSVTEIFAATLWVSDSGPFAWDGIMAFWFNMVLYVPWQFIVYFCIYRAITNQPDNELGNAGYVPGATYA
jgi:hypothetical protein